MDISNEKMFRSILDSIPYQITFVDKDFIIRFMNRESIFYNEKMYGYKDLIGKSLFDCHPPVVHEPLRKAIKQLENHIPEIFLRVSGCNRIYINPVRDENGEFIGFFERFEQNLFLDPDKNRSYTPLASLGGGEEKSPRYHG